MRLLFRLSLLLTFSVIDAEIQIAEYGGCLDPAAVPGQRAFHCHFDDRHCKDGEQWLNPIEVIDQGYGPCTCDTDYLTPVFLHGCYANGVVFCAAERSQCDSTSSDFGDRYNSGNDIIDGCGDGSIAAGAFTDTSCGKQCQCNYKYYNNGNVVEAGSTEYGACYDANIDQFTCAIYDSECEKEVEVFYPSSSPFLEERGVNCRCDDVTTGACVNPDSGTIFCAVSESSCPLGQTFLTRNELSESSFSTDCRLCENTWDAPTPSPTSCTTGSTFSLELQTDTYGSETTWTLISESTGDSVTSGGPYGANVLIDEVKCLDDGCYEFTIFDSYNDGICCTYGDGFYRITVDGELIKEGGQFTEFDTATFCVGSQCSDSPLDFALTPGDKGCEFIAANPNTNQLCDRPGVGISSHCPDTCASCSEYGCKDSEAKFKFRAYQIYCEDIPVNLRDQACSIEDVSNTCRETCGYCN